MRRIFLSAAITLLLTVITAAAGKEVGEIGSINPSSKEIIVNIKSGTDLKMGDKLEIQSNDGKIVLEVTFPMQTVSKCKIQGKGKLTELSKGMKVYRYSKDEPAEESSGKAGETRKFGGIEFVSIPGGTYMMGSPMSEKDRGDDEKQHRVTVSPFWMGKYEVTQKQYEDIMGTKPSYFKGDNLPVERVSWYNAVEYCNKLSIKHGLKPYYKIDKSRKDPNNTNDYDDLKYTVTILGGNGFRLPTEAEWEYACRAGTTTTYYWGNTFDGDYMWYDSNSGNKTHPVGEKKPNAFGLYDMSGNVWEWCMDWYDEEYYSRSLSKNPQGALSGSYRVLRGGSWNDYDDLLRSAIRHWFWALYRYTDYGFRVAVSR